MNKNLLIFNASSGTILYLLSVVVTFLLTPVIVNSLGRFDYGLWEMLVSIVGYMGILDLGIGPALLRNVAISNAQNDSIGLQKTFSTALIFFCCVSLISILFYTFLFLFPEFLFGNEQNDLSRLRIVIIMFAINTCIVFPTNVYVGTLFGFQQHFYVNITRGILLILNGIFTYFLLKFKYADGLLVLASLQFLSNVIQFVVYTFLIKNNNLLIFVSFNYFSFQMLRELFLYGVKSSILMISSRLQFATMPFIIAKAASVDSIIFYSIPCRLIDYARGFSLAVGFPLTPHFTSLIGKNDRDALIGSWLESALFLQIITGSMVIFLYFCGDLFLKLWIGNNYLISGSGVVTALLVGMLFQAFSPNSLQMLLASSQHGKVALLHLIFALFSIPMAYFSTLYYGVIGAAFSNSFVISILSVITLTAACSFLNVSFLTYIKKSIVPLLPSLIILGFSLWIINYHFAPSNYIGLIINVFIGCAVYYVSIWHFVLSDKVRYNIKNHIFKLFKHSI
jgi:O-antigen/teichoic acid export membrane protein